ncbi:MAG: hypothetical protein ACLUFN_07535 [Eubacterium sp.]
MAKIILAKDLDRLIRDLRKTQVDLASIMGKSAYKGAEYMADELKKSLQALPTYNGKNGFPKYVYNGHKLKGLSSIQKRDVIEAFGISKMMNTNGYIHVKIGFDGYGSYETNAHPWGIPNQLLMRSLEKGTSFLKKNPVITTTVKREKKATEKKLEEAFINEIKKEIK